MQQSKRDYEAFTSLMEQLCATWNKPANDALFKAYWAALKDARLEEVQRNVERILRTAGPKQNFPKPAELRDSPERESTPSDEARFAAAVERNTRNWDAFFRDDPELASLEFGYARAARILATDHPSSPQYAQAMRESRHYRDLSYALLMKRLDKAITEVGEA